MSKARTRGVLRPRGGLRSPQRHNPLCRGLGILLLPYGPWARIGQLGREGLFGCRPPSWASGDLRWEGRCLRKPGVHY
jgi:hypothetical protein